MCVNGVSAVLNLSQRFKVSQENVAQPLGVNARDLPLLGLLVLQTAGSGGKSTRPAGYWHDSIILTETSTT